MFAVYAAEQQYHHDIRTRENDRRILASIRERSAVAPLRTDAVAAPRTAAVVAANPQRSAWARPIGVAASHEPITACAVA